MTEQVPPAGTPDLPPEDGEVGGARASAPAMSRTRKQARPRRGGAPGGVSSDSADVIVVGGGPAGSSVAYYLANAGLDVLVLEKTRYPREKVCGDGLTPRAVKAADRNGRPDR